MTKPIPSLTIVSVTGAQHYAQGSVYAIATSYLELKDKIPNIECKLISPEPPEDLPAYIQHIPCKPFSYFEYNLFMIYGLGQIIETDFCLVVQNDGWVMNGNNWRNDFFEYDYIGAPLSDVIEVKNNKYVRRFPLHFWLEHKNHLPKNCYETQNGGFSLRSKRLLDAPRKLGLTLEIASFDDFTQLPLSMEWNFDGQHIQHAEDAYLSVIKRKLLEKHGFKFAPRRLSAYFGVELIFVQENENIGLSKVLGCHLSSLCTLTGIKEVQINAVVDSLNIFDENEILKQLSETNHTFVIPKQFNQIP